MKKQALWLIGLTLIAAAVAALFVWNSDAGKDRRAWRRFTRELTDANVTKIEFGGARLMTLSETDRRELLAILRAARFERSNRAAEGLTPQAVISIVFRDGSQVNIGMWSLTTYELSPRHLDSGAQFLIKSEQLGIWLKNRFTGPAIGAGGQKAPGAVPFHVRDSSVLSCQYTAQTTAAAMSQGMPATSADTSLP